MLILDPQIITMADSNQQAIKKLNWTLLARELKKFGIDIESEVREIIQSGNIRKIEDIFAFIVSFERGRAASPFLRSCLPVRVALFLSSQ